MRSKSAGNFSTPSKAPYSLLLVALLLTASCSLVCCQLRGAETATSTVRSEAPESAVQTPRTMQNPYAPARAAETARTQQEAAAQQAAGRGGGLRPQQTTSPPPRQTEFPGAQTGPVASAGRGNAGNNFRPTQASALAAHPPPSAVTVQPGTQKEAKAGSAAPQQPNQQGQVDQQQMQQRQWSHHTPQHQLQRPQQQHQQQQGPIQQRQQQRGGKWRVAGSAPQEDPRPIGAGMAGRPTGMDRGAVVLTDETFASFVKTEPFALVLFYAPWCHWSRATLPEFDAVARFMSKVASRPIVLGKVNCDDNPGVQKSEHILEFPIIKLYIDGKPKQYVGGRRRTQIFAWLNHNLQRDERLDTIPHLDEFMRIGSEGHQLVVAVTTPDNTDGTAGGDSPRFNHEVFRHAARSFSDDVLFGEIHEPFAFQHFLHHYLLPHSRTSPDMWLPPFIVTMPPDPADPPFVKYLGRGDDLKELDRFIHKYRFPQVLPFEPETIEDIFDDGRSICLLLLDGDRAAKSLTREGLVDPVVAAFHDVAGEFREDLIFTISGNKEAHERRIFSLLGVDENITAPVMRIATFNPSGNGKYYPARKFRPLRPFKPGQMNPEYDDSGSDSGRPGDVASNKAVYSFRNRSPTHSLIVNALTTSAKAHNSFRSPHEKAHGVHGEPDAKHGETAFDAQQRQEQLEAAKIIRDFSRAFLDEQLEPYTNSEPIPPASQNTGPVKTIVGLNFQAEVIDSPNDVFVTFGAPWCGHCRKLEPALKRVAEIVTKNSSLVMAKIDATLNELDGINLSGYPTLLLFRAGSKQQPIMYDGDRSESDMLVWLARNAQHSRLNVKDLMEKLKNLMSGGGVKDAKMAKTSVLEEL